MRFAEREWTLVCYAGPASEASTGSRPVGSELKGNRRMAGLPGQLGFGSVVFRRSARRDLEPVA